MGHGITATDGGVYVGKRAWHGLGKVIPDAVSPREALTLIGAEWGVEQWPLYATSGDQRIVVESHRLNVRADDKTILGVVTSGYQPLQNVDLADFAEALSMVEGSSVKIESAGTLFGGKKIFFLLRSESVWGPGGDELCQYCLVSNGHDGQTCLRVTPTSIRVVCWNTWQMVLGHGAEDLSRAGYVARHSGDMAAKVEAAKEALQVFRAASDSTQQVVRTLARRPVASTAELGEFFAAQYSRDFGPIPKNPTDKSEQRARERAVESFRAFSRRWDQEQQQFGANLWVAANAYTGLIQHDRKSRGVNDAARVERRIDSNLFGLGADRTSATFEAALAMCS